MTYPKLNILSVPSNCYMTYPKLNILSVPSNHIHSQTLYLHILHYLHDFALCIMNTKYNSPHSTTKRNKFTCK